MYISTFRRITFIGVLVLISRQARQDEDFLSTESRGILAKTTSGFFLALIAPWPFLMSLLSYVLSIGMRVTVLRVSECFPYLGCLPSSYRIFYLSTASLHLHCQHYLDMAFDESFAGETSNSAF